MKWWESVNDKAHDFARWVKGWGSRDAKKVDDDLDQNINWTVNGAYEGSDQSMIWTENEAYEEHPHTATIYDNARDVVNDNVIKNAPDYEKVSHSPSVKSLIRHIDNFEQAMIHIRTPKKEGTDMEFINALAQTNSEVVEYMQEISSYLVRKAQSLAQKTGRYNGVREACEAEVKKIRLQMDLVTKIQEKCLKALNKGKDMPYVDQSYRDILKDQNLQIFQVTNDTELKELGSGGINTVYELDKDNKVDDHKDKKRVLKRGHEFVDFSNGGEATVFERTRLMKTETIDTNEAYAMNTSYRDVAVSLVDRLFHLNAAVKTTFARAENGDQASLMHKAKGSDVFHSYAYMDDKGKRRAGIMKQILINKEFLSKGVDPKTLHKRENDDAHNAYVDKVNAGIRDAQKRGMVNINSAAFLESTYNLAALDYIVGHVDRHAGNIMMTESGVQGIDNDSAFSLRVKGGELGSETKNVSAGQMVKYARDSKGAGGESVFGLNAESSQAILYFDTAFPCVTEEFRQKILRVSPSTVEGMLKGLIADDELKACVERVELLQEYLRGLKEDKIVKSFDEVDREHYSNQMNNEWTYVFTNVMSQVRGVGKEKVFSEEEFSGEFLKTWGATSATKGAGGAEIEILGEYVNRLTGFLKGRENNKKVVFYLFKALEKRAEAGDFDLYDEIKNGNLDKMVEEIKQKVEAEENT